MVSTSKCHSQPVNSLIVIETQRMMKNCTVRLMTHCIVTEIGGVYCGPWGCSMAKIDQITAEMPRYTENMTKYRITVKIVPTIFLFTSYSTSPSPLSPFFTEPPRTKGIVMARMHWIMIA